MPLNIILPAYYLFGGEIPYRRSDSLSLWEQKLSEMKNFQTFIYVRAHVALKSLPLTVLTSPVLLARSTYPPACLHNNFNEK